VATLIKRHRNSAFERQNGKCCYCGFQMWRDTPEAFAATHGIKAAQARHFQCTAEHLVARQDGGKDGTLNIAAACIRCNQLRHKRKNSLEPKLYQRHVQQRLDRGGWHILPPRAKLTRGKPPLLQP